jgi:hypothetical protein
MRCSGILVLVTVLVLTAVPARADIYRWVDDHGNAHYADGHDAVPERYRSRAAPLGMRNAPPPAAGATSTGAGGSAPAGATVGDEPAGGTVLRYRPGERIMVDVRLNGRASARLMLDTGADRTLINPRSLIAAGVPLQRAVGRSEVRGVTGKDTVLWVVVDSLEVGQARVTKIPVAAYEMGAYESDGLLGRDFLDRFNLSIDASRGLVTLTPR